MDLMNLRAHLNTDRSAHAKVVLAWLPCMELAMETKLRARIQEEEEEHFPLTFLRCSHLIWAQVM